MSSLYTKPAVSFTVALGLGVFWNWPRRRGLASMFGTAGCPWIFAKWTGATLDWFSGAALTGDIAVGLGIAVACAYSTARYSRSTPGE